jgi:hypothetical protein
MTLANAWFRAKPSCCERCGGESLRYARESECPEGEKVQVNALWVCQDCGHCFAVPVSRKHAVYVLLGGLILIAIGTGTLVSIVVSGAGFQASLFKALFASGLISGGAVWTRRGWILAGQAWGRARRKALAGRGEPGCPQCGYDLRGNDSGACPECGAENEWGSGTDG